MYVLLFVGSIVSIFAPSEVLLQQSSTSLTRIWAAFFAVASLICLLGCLFDRWIFEYIAIPLLTSTLLVFGVSLLSSAITTNTALIVPYSMFYGAFSFSLFARWKDVRCMLKVAVSLAECKRDECDEEKESNL